MDAESQLLADLDAEIARLKLTIALQKEALDRWADSSDEKVTQLCGLITELCDALESIPIDLHPPHRELIQRAREATK